MKRFAVLAVIVALALGGCSSRSAKNNDAELGTAQNPIKMAMVPSVETTKLLASGKALEKLLTKETGLHFETSVPTSYAAVIEAMASDQIDVGWLPPLPYVLAHDNYGVEVVLVTERGHATDYRSLIIARADSPLNKLADLKGRKFAYGDPISTSGTIYPKHLIRMSGYDPDRFFSQVVYAGKHDQVISAVVNKQVDAGAIYGSDISDARELIQASMPDVVKVTKVIAKSELIPNDTVSVRKGFPKEIAEKLKEGLIKIAKTDEGRRTVMDLYGIDGFQSAKDSDYESVRKVAESENITLDKYGDK